MCHITDPILCYVQVTSTESSTPTPGSSYEITYSRAVILSSRSQFFASLADKYNIFFTTPITDDTPILQIPIPSPSTFDPILHWIYTGNEMALLTTIGTLNTPVSQTICTNIIQNAFHLGLVSTFWESVIPYIAQVSGSFGTSIDMSAWPVEVITRIKTMGGFKRSTPKPKVLPTPIITRPTPTTITPPPPDNGNPVLSPAASEYATPTNTIIPVPPTPTRPRRVSISVENTLDVCMTPTTPHSTQPTVKFAPRPRRLSIASISSQKIHPVPKIVYPKSPIWTKPDTDNFGSGMKKVQARFTLRKVVNGIKKLVFVEQAEFVGSVVVERECDGKVVGGSVLLSA